MKLISYFSASAVLTAMLLVPGASFALQTPAPAPSSTGKNATGANKPAAASVPTAQEIADAKSKGLVWVNLNTKVYHKEGSAYGATKKGKFMTEADATKAGYRAAKEPATGKKNASPAAKPPAK